MTLAEFLAARLDEDEAAAKDAHYEGQRWITEEEGVYRWPDDELVQMADRKADARHIARHDPARVLREVGAKRKILELIVPELERWRGFVWSEYNSFPDYDGDDLLKIMAVAYSDHPEYRAEWAP